MPSEELLLRNISDTARWVAVYRANENDRPDAVFRDPFARKLAGQRGHDIVKLMKYEKNQWPFVARTLTIDQFIMTQVQQGVDMVINLAAGLDTRPYRLTLPSTLTWVEIDLPEILEYKEEILAAEKPRCALERVHLDLADEAARRAMFQSLNGRATRVLVVSEGLLIYLSPEQVTGLARDLAAQPAFEHWIAEIGSPGLLKMMTRQVGKALDAAGAPFKFAPEEGPDFFVPLGWKPIEVKSMLRVAADLKRLPFILSLFARLPEPKGPPGRRPWSGVCLFARNEAARKLPAN